MGCERLQPILSQNVYKYACHYRIYQQATSVNGLLLLVKLLSRYKQRIVWIIYTRGKGFFGTIKLRQF